MSSITVSLPPDTERKLREKAVSVGVTLETYIGRLAETDVSNGSFDQIVAPVRAAFKESGLTDDDVTALVQEAREEVWREKLAGKKL